MNDFCSSRKPSTSNSVTLSTTGESERPASASKCGNVVREVERRCYDQEATSTLKPISYSRHDVTSKMLLQDTLETNVVQTELARRSCLASMIRRRTSRAHDVASRRWRRPATCSTTEAGTAHTACDGSHVSQVSAVGATVWFRIASPRGDFVSPTSPPSTSLRSRPACRSLEGTHKAGHNLPSTVPERRSR